MPSLEQHALAELQRLSDAGLRRTLRTLDSAQDTVVRWQGRDVVNFSSNDYLGLACSAELRAAMREGIERFGVGAGASRLVCGNLSPHEELEAALAAFKGTEAALAFSSGYATALGVIPAMVGEGDTLILDKLCHASLIDAAKLSGATIRVFPHNHLGKLERLLSGIRAKNADARVLVVTESIFSMDGDAASLPEIVELKDRFGTWLMVDEAHAVGVLGPQGRGLAAELGVEDRIELQMGTLGKALGVSGGYVACSNAVRDLLVNKARSFIYSTAPPPAVAWAAKEAVKLAQNARGDALREKLKAHKEALLRFGAGRPASEFSLPLTSSAPKGRDMPAQGSALGHPHKETEALKGRHKPEPTPCAAPSGLDATAAIPRALPWAGMSQALGLSVGERGLTSTISAAILPLIIGDEGEAMRASAALLDAGFLIPAIRYPTVARGTARLRLTLSAAHEAGQLERLVARLHDCVPQLLAATQRSTQESSD